MSEREEAFRRYDLYFEDLSVGDTFWTEGATLSEGQMLGFAMTWDPQPIHMDVTSPRTVEAGGLMGSGLLTICVTFRLFFDSGVLTASNTASPGIDKLRWLKPVRPGDTLRVKSVVTSVRPSKGKPRGVVVMDHVTMNQHDEAVMSLECVHLLKRRDGKVVA